VKTKSFISFTEVIIQPGTIHAPAVAVMDQYMVQELIPLAFHGNITATDEVCVCYLSSGE
jgi:hypothetical protein